MTRTLPMPPGIVAAPPIWALSAEHSAARLARFAAERAAAAEAETFITQHPAPWYGEPVTAGARRLHELATTHGMVAELRDGLDWCAVEGYHIEAGVGFRATWERGRAKLGIWYERTARYGYIHDERPAHDVTVTRNVKGKAVQVPHPNRMPLGLERDHLVLLGGPSGVLVGVTEVSARVKALGL